MKFCAFVILMVIGMNAFAQQPQAVQWSVTPYLWASQINVDLAFRDQALGGDTISFRDLLDQLDTAVMVHAEGGRGRWSGLIDLTYLETSATQKRSVFTVDTESNSSVLDAGFAYWPGGVGSALSFIGGVRYTGFDDRYTVSLADTVLTRLRNDEDYLDALLGVRYRFDLAERWALLTHADFSFGDSEGTYLLSADLAWTIGERQANRIIFGYQYKQAEFTSGDLKSDFRYHGPRAGFNFRF